MDIREELNQRRRELDLLEAQDRMMLTDRKVETDAYKRAVDRQREREHIEATLATYQLADAQYQAVRTQAEGNLIQQELVQAQQMATAAQVAATEQQRVANDVADKAKGKNEETQFWSRRYLTNLLVGNAAGFVAVLTFMLKEDSPAIDQEDVLTALAAFGIGAVLGGVMPLFRLVEINLGSGFHKVGEGAVDRTTWWGRFYSDNGLNAVAALGGTLLFAVGLMIVIGCARGYYSARGPETGSKSEVIVRLVDIPARP